MIKNILNFLFLLTCSLSAQAWEPSKPITVTIGFAPGSGNEISFRGFSSILEKSNPKINFNVENRPGVNGIIAMNEFIKKPADGHNIYIASHQGIWVTAEFSNPEAKKYTFDDIEYGLTLAKSPLAIIAHTSSQTTTPSELVSRFKNTQQPINIAAGSGAHKLAYEYLMHHIKGNRDLIKTIPYKGPAQAAQDVAAGVVEFGIIPVTVANTLLGTGKIKIIAITSEYKIEAIKDVPLMKDHVPGLNVYAAWGIVFPKGTSKEAINWYVNNFTSVIRSPEGQQFMKNNLMFAEPKEHTPDGFKTSMMRLRDQWVPIIKIVGWSD
jgi:tripartite-type tricarboxylate transporter receptor subunit TctC